MATLVHRSRERCIPTTALVMMLVCLAACDVGGGGGGGPAMAALAPPRPFHPEANPDPAARGARIYAREGCALCHGDAGKGGVENANSETAGKINGLTLVKEGYSKKDLIKKIAEGQYEVGKTNKSGPTPPLRMPPFGKWLTEAEIGDVAEYLLSLFPKDRKIDDDWGDDDEGGDKSGADKGAADDDEDDGKAAAGAGKGGADKSAAGKDKGKGAAGKGAALKGGAAKPSADRGADKGAADKPPGESEGQAK